MVLNQRLRQNFWIWTKKTIVDIEAQKNILREQYKRKRQDNLSFFAFTATPKWKTLALFDEPNEQGETPFHRYTMKQAIEEALF